MKKIIFLIFATFYIISFGSNVFAQQSGSPKVVYHIDDAKAQGLKSLRNLGYHLDVAPDTTIVVVVHSYGYELLMDGAKDKKTNIEYAPLIAALKSRGVKFEICERTLTLRNLKKNQFVLETDFVPSGLVRITDLQYREGFAYIKP